MARHGYRGDGAFGQFCVILPEHDTVVVTTAYTLQMQAVLDAMWAHLLPGLGATAPDTGSAHDELTDRLARLALPACAAAPAPAGWASWTGMEFTVTSGAGGATEVFGALGGGQIQPTVSSVAMAPGVGGAQITLIEPANSLTFGVGAGEWTVSAPADGHGDTIPVAASGGWLDDRTFRAEVIFLETPHRMDITCSLAGRRAEAVWRHPPLSRNRLQDLHCPS